MNLGKAVKVCRTSQNLNQTILAERAGISISYLSLLERGKRDPNTSTIEALSMALGIPVIILFFLAAEKKDLIGIEPELIEKLSYTTLKLIEAKG